MSTSTALLSPVGGCGSRGVSLEDAVGLDRMLHQECTSGCFAFFSNAGKRVRIQYQRGQWIGSCIGISFWERIKSVFSWHSPRIELKDKVLDGRKIQVLDVTANEIRSGEFSFARTLYLASKNNVVGANLSATSTTSIATAVTTTTTTASVAVSALKTKEDPSDSADFETSTSLAKLLNGIKDHALSKGELDLDVENIVTEGKRVIDENLTDRFAQQSCCCSCFSGPAKVGDCSKERDRIFSRARANKPQVLGLKRYVDVYGQVLTGFKSRNPDLQSVVRKLGHQGDLADANAELYADYEARCIFETEYREQELKEALRQAGHCSEDVWQYLVGSSEVKTIKDKLSQRKSSGSSNLDNSVFRFLYEDQIPLRCFYAAFSEMLKETRRPLTYDDLKTWVRILKGQESYSILESSTSTTTTSSSLEPSFIEHTNDTVVISADSKASASVTAASVEEKTTTVAPATTSSTTTVSTLATSTTTTSSDRASSSVVSEAPAKDSADEEVSDASEGFADGRLALRSFYGVVKGDSQAVSVDEKSGPASDNSVPCGVRAKDRALADKISTMGKSIANMGAFKDGVGAEIIGRVVATLAMAHASVYSGCPIPRLSDYSLISTDHKAVTDMILSSWAVASGVVQVSDSAADGQGMRQRSASA